MQTSRKTIASSPTFPALLALPLRIIPLPIHTKLLVTSLNRIFHEDLKSGELNFMRGKVIHISIDDAKIEFHFSIKNNRLIVVDRKQPADLFLNGSLYDYILLASRSEDTDTLFFNRRLHMQGDTELGLYVKNFLDGMDMDTHKIPRHLGDTLKKILPVYERFFG